VIGRSTHHTNGRSADDPTELPPLDRVVANHVPNGLVEPIRPEGPRESNALEEDDPEEHKPAHGVLVQEMEDVHSALESRKRRLRITGHREGILRDIICERVSEERRFTRVTQENPTR
jgi:hypothetical protein